MTKKTICLYLLLLTPLLEAHNRRKNNPCSRLFAALAAAYVCIIHPIEARPLVTVPLSVNAAHVPELTQTPSCPLIFSSKDNTMTLDPRCK